MADLEQHLHHLKLPVVTRTNKEESIGVGSYASVYEVMVHGTVCAAKKMHPALMNEANKRAFLLNVFNVVEYFTLMWYSS